MPVVNWEIRSGRDARRVIEENSAKVLVKEYLAEFPEPTSANPLEDWSHKAAIWPNLSCMAMNLIS